MNDIHDNPKQEDIAQTWAQKAEKILQASIFPAADGQAWLRDAAKAGAPLSKEPLASLRARIADTAKSIEELQHRSMVQKEAAVLLAQRIDVLSTKSWRHAVEAFGNLQADVRKWQDIASQLGQHPHWQNVEPRYNSALESSGTQLALVFDAFSQALDLARAAAEDSHAELPKVQVWADELRQLHGLSAPQPETAAAPVSPEQLAQIEQAIEKVEQAVKNGQAKESAQAAGTLRETLKTVGALADAELEQRINRALIDAGDLQGWQRWGANQVREELIARAEKLLAAEDGQPPVAGSKKLQQQLRDLREQWRQVDRSSPPNGHLWKRFDEAAGKAHAVVEEWLGKVKAEAAEHKAERNRILDELLAWGEAWAQEGGQNLKALQRGLQQFGSRWRAAGHVNDKIYAQLQERWKTAYDRIAAPLEQARKQSIAARRALIEEAEKLGSAAQLNVGAIKQLQQRWQAEAQNVPLDRKQEQKLWDAFRQPLDAAFSRSSAQREQAVATVSAHDQAVLDAARALEDAIQSGDAASIRQAAQALEHVSQHGSSAPVPEPAAPAASDSGGVAESSAADAASIATPESADAGAEQPAEKPAPAPAAPKPVIAVRGDDRPGAQRDQAASQQPAERGGRKGAGGAGSDRRPARPPRPQAAESERRSAAPRLGDRAFRAQRNALENAQLALRKLASQAHGESLVQLLDAWQSRDGNALPSAAQLGKKISNANWNLWQQAIGNASGNPTAANQALLRLEIAAEVPTPAHALTERRVLQLQLLTQKHAASPAETWQEDVAKVLSAPAGEEGSKRLQTALKALLRQ